MRLRADQLGSRTVEAVDCLLVRGVRLVATDARFELEVTDDRIGEARTIFWNGPMGVFEWPRFADGTKAVAEAVAAADAFSVVGGADSIRALNELGLTDEVSWASTGGGAALELLEGKELPGVAVIPSA